MKERNLYPKDSQKDEIITMLYNRVDDICAKIEESELKTDELREQLRDAECDLDNAIEGDDDNEWY